MADQNPKFDAAAFVDQAAVLLDIALDPTWRPGVIENLERSRAIAQPLLDFDFPDHLELGPVFRP